MRPTDEQLLELMALEEKALSGRWQQHGSHIYGPDMERKLIAQFFNMGTTCSYTDLVANAELVITSRNHIRAIVEELLERRAAMEWKPIADAPYVSRFGFLAGHVGSERIDHCFHRDTAIRLMHTHYRDLPTPPEERP